MTDGKFVWEDGDIKFSICPWCKYKTPNQGTCSAYPEGIPETFLAGETDHIQPASGDSGIQFTKGDLTLPQSIQDRLKGE